MKQERSNAQDRAHLLEIFQAALAGVAGAGVVACWLRANPIAGELRILAVGKAAQSMADGAAGVLGERIRRGLIISKQGHLDPLRCRRRGWEAMVASHPVPDAGSLEAGRRLLDFLAEPDPRPLLFLLSGGASSLVEVPVAGVDLDFLARANRWLLGSGLDIVQMNWVRKGLSRIKGGGLLGYLGDAEVYALAISDVPGDRPGAIGSGLLVPEPDLVDRLATLSLPVWLRERLEQGLGGRPALPAEVPPLRILANLERAKEAAAARARELGYSVRLHRALLQGEAAATGRSLAEAVREGPSGISIWGGETTVRLPFEPGVGGRNQHLALAGAMVLAGCDSCYLLAAGTDGTDGPTEDAGALVDGQTLRRASVEGFDAGRVLAAADAGRLLAASGDLISTGPTGTNVMDLVIGLKTD